MCDVLTSIAPANVVIVYKQTGLGYAGRPGGPLPTITVSLQDMQFNFFFLSALLGVHIAMPAMTTTITAEDLVRALAIDIVGRRERRIFRWPFFFCTEMPPARNSNP